MKINLWTNGMNRAGKALCALCAVALSATFTGCEYDDTDLNNRLEELEQRVTELEKNLNSQIGALQQMLEGKLTIASCTFDQKTGLYTIVLSDGQAITVATAGEGASLISVVEENGAYYWTLNGEPLTDAEGNKLPVAVAPGVRVNTATNEWEVSPDGGKSWLSTGIEAEEGASLFAKVEEDEGFVYFTLSDGTRLKVARSTDFRCTTLAGKQYFAPGERRTIKLDMSDVRKTTITKPDGWKASIVNSELRITAPETGNSYAETSGKVAVVAVASNGQSQISEVAVEIGTAPHELTVDADLNVTITIDPKLPQDWEYQGYYYGVRKLGEFSPEQVLEDIRNDTRTMPITTPVSTTLEAMLGAKPEQGVSYVIYAVDEYYDNAAGGNVLGSPEEMLYTVAQSIYAKIEISDVTYEGAELSVDAMGVAQCWAGVTLAVDYTPEQILADIRDEWTAPAKIPARYTGSLSSYSGGIVLQPGKEYLVWVLPYVPGKDEETYTLENFFTQKVTISDIVAGGDATVEIGEVTSTMKTVSATITPGAGVYKFYSQYVTADEYAQAQDDQWIRDLVAFGTATTAPNTCTIEKEGLAPDTKGYILSVAVTKDGKASPLIRKSADSQPLTFSAETITAETLVVSLNSAEIKLSGSASIVSYRYANLTLSDWTYGYPWQGDETIMEKELALATDEIYPFAFADAVDGVARLSLTELISGTSYYLFALGVDKDGKPTKMVKVEYTPTIPAELFAREGSDLWNANYEQRPKLSNLKVELNTLNPGSDFYIVSADVTAGEKCAKYWIYAGPDDPANGAVGAQNKTLAIITSYDTKSFTGNQTGAVLNEWGDATNNVYVVWQDTDGIYYQYEKIAEYVPPVE